jgi:adenosylmethionine-8-amino-7-oxononanoate aminotransferase
MFNTLETPHPVSSGNAVGVTRSDNLWHPFTQMQEYAELPELNLVSGKGGWLTDQEGNRYLDGNASIWTNVHGHNDPELNQALINQLNQVAHSTLLGVSHPKANELAQVLARLAPPGLDKVFFTDNGSGAVEVALKLSFQYWQLKDKGNKQHVIGLSNGYHGDTFGTMAVGDSGFFHDRFRHWCFKASHIPGPSCQELNGKIEAFDALESLKALEDTLRYKHTQIASVIIEPSVQGAAGMKLLPPGYTASVSLLCKKYDVHLICDEVFVGFGRLGSFIISTEEKVVPDFICLAKGLTAGYLPLAATLVKNEIYNAFLGTYDSRKAFFHGHTFTGNPLGCAVALENIRKLEILISSGKLACRIKAFGALIETAFKRHPKVLSLRQRGLTAAIDLDSTAKRYLNDEYPQMRLGLRICLEARRHGLLLRPLGNSLLLVPPLCLTEDELSQLVQKTLISINTILP